VDQAGRQDEAELVDLADRRQPQARQSRTEDLS
jgi:hypothetical protein